MNNVPQHIAIIMDGNGRWAQQRGQARSAGHVAGVETTKDIIADCVRLGVKYLTVYAFSTENWGRPENEVAALMGLILTELKEELFVKHHVRMRWIGDRSRMPEQVKKHLETMEEETKDFDAMTLTVAISYSSRWELTDAMKTLARTTGMTAVAYSGTRYDLGSKLGFLMANVEQGAKHPEIGEAFKAYLKDYVKTL